MGEVYRARDTRLGRDVAIKVLPESLAGNSEALARFEREARAVAALSHPNILAIHDFGSENGVAYAAMELLEGATLRERLEGGALPPRKAIEIGLQIARGLAAAHAKGIVHRDLKPENVFVLADGHVKILDFGLAKVERAGEGRETSRAHDAAQTEPGDRDGNRRLHVAGAGAGRGGRPADRHLLVRRDPVRDAFRDREHSPETRPSRR